MKKILLAFSLLSVLSCGSEPEKPPIPAPKLAPDATFELPRSLDEAVNTSPFRTEANKARDPFRHPAETLKFFGITPSMKLIEIWPAGGWYTEILAPFLIAKGQYVGALNHTISPESPDFNPTLNAWIKKHSEAASKIQWVEFTPPEHLELGPEASADAIVTFRNLHNWMKKNAAKLVFQSFYKTLKPGGIFGIVEHRASSKVKQDPQAESGYVREDYVIELAKSVGFHLVDKSEINANPKDTKDHPRGVWTLPPSYKLEDVDHDKYAAIGESDRMTLKFVKPM